MDLSYVLVGGGSAVAALSLVGGTYWLATRKNRRSERSSDSFGPAAEAAESYEPASSAAPTSHHREEVMQRDVLTEDELRARLTTATNFEECLRIHRMVEEGSQLEREAVEKFNRLAREELAQLSSVAACWAFYEDLPVERIGESRVIADAAIGRLLELLTESYDAADIHNKYVNGRNEDLHVSRIRERFNELARAELAAATSVDEAFAVYAAMTDADIGDSSSIGDEALEKAIGLASDHEAMAALLDEYNSYDTNDDVLAKMDAKLIELLRTHLAGLTTVDACWKFIENDVPDDEAEASDALTLEAYERILALTTDFEEAQTLYNDMEGDFIEEAFIERVLTRALEFASSASDASWVVDESPEDSDVERAARAKWLSLTTTVADCESVWNDFGVESEFGESAIVRAAEIIRSRENTPTS